MTDRRIKGSHGLKGRRLEMEIPVSFEQVLIRAGEDGGFREALLEDPAAALEAQGIEMKPSETAMLLGMRRGVLETMIDRFRPEVHGQSRFARKVAAAVAGSLVVGVVSCGEAGSEADAIIDAVGGMMPDIPLDVSLDPEVEEVVDDQVDDDDSSDMMDVEDDVDEDSADDMEESDG